MCHNIVLIWSKVGTLSHTTSAHLGVVLTIIGKMLMITMQEPWIAAKIAVRNRELAFQ